MTAPDPTAALPKCCDNRSVGVIITDETGRYLVFDRATFPPGVAACAGHVDQHGSDEDAARAEAFEESGLAVDSLTIVATGWRANPCRRMPGPRGVGHVWTVFAATAHGVLSPSPRETRNIRWITRAELHKLYVRTLGLAMGAITPEEFEQQPGLSPVWALWFHRVGALVATEAELTLLERLDGHNEPFAKDIFM